MTNNTSLSSVFSSALTAQQILDLANTADLTGMDTFQLKEFNEAIEALKEQARIDAEYQQDVEAVAEHQAKREAAEAISNTQRIKEAKVGNMSLADAAFVPNMQDKYEDDDNDVVVSANAMFDDDDSAEVVAKGFRGDPDDGMHQVILVDYPERQQGKNGNGDYRIFRMRDVKLFNEWTLIVSEADLGKRLQEISYNNKGMLAGMTKKRCFASLMVNPVDCWTVKNQKGRVVTYFDEVGYEAYFRWVQSEKASKEDRYASIHSKEVSADEKEAEWSF